MTKNINTNEQLSRMKSLMNYGLQTESKNAPYSSVEYQKMGADGKMYGIVREGTKFYIKSAPNKAKLVKEDFAYIGGFRNRKDNEYNSFAMAQKQFDLKMMSIKEAANKNDFSVTSWDLDKKENVVIEASEKMKKEILRERQIMKNAALISEKKGCCKDGECVDDKKFTDFQKGNVKGTQHSTGKPTDVEDGFSEDPKFPENCSKTINGNLVEGDVLGWNRGNDDYLDTTHGTEVGDSAPFDGPTARNIDNQDKKVTNSGEMNNGVVEGKAMHNTDNQNEPTPGVGEIGDNAPFDGEKGKQIDEAVDGLGSDEDPVGDDAGMQPGDDEMGDGEPVGGEEDFSDEDFGDEGLDDEEPMGDEFGDEDFEDGELDDDEIEGEDELYNDELESRISDMEDLLMQIADKLGIDAPGVDDAEYGDDDLFGDEDFDDEEPMDDEFGDEGLGDEEPMDDEFGDEDLDDEEFDDEEPIEDDLDFEQPTMESRRSRKPYIYESAGFKKEMRRRRMNEDGPTPFKDAGRVPSGNMNKLDMWGKHPAYQKKVMELPPKDMQEFPGYYDMNDDSVRSDAPYGEKIGSGAPFNVDPQAIDNAIAEAFRRMKKKI